MPRFDYERHLADLTARDPRWPEGTRAVSELRLSLRVRPAGMLAGLRGARVVHLDVVDYPGEWLLDLGLMEKSYEAWSERALTRLASWGADAYATQMRAADGAAKLDEPMAQGLARSYAAALAAARAAGAYDLTPGRFLLPGEMEGSPALTFAPLPPGRGGAARVSLRAGVRPPLRGLQGPGGAARSSATTSRGSTGRSSSSTCSARSGRRPARGGRVARERWPTC